MRTVRWEHEAVEELLEIASRHRADGRRILQTVKRFASDDTGDIKKLQGDGAGFWRMRSGDWRIIIQFEPGGTMVVARVVLRRDAYD